MSTAPRSTTGGGDRSPAQLFALIVGSTLVLVGIIGFLADASFEVGTPHESGDLLGIFEVNGIHNIVHILTGALLLSGAGRADMAVKVTTIFVAAYGLVTLIGLIQGDTVLGLVPVNAADNVLHIALTLTGVGALLAERSRKSAGAAH